MSSLNIELEMELAERHGHTENVTLSNNIFGDRSPKTQSS